MASAFSLKKLFGKTAQNWSGPRDVEVGMRYRQTRQMGSIWIVIRTVKPLGNELPHVMIAREGYLDETRVISVSALRDRNFYRYVPPEDPPVEEDAGDGPTPSL